MIDMIKYLTNNVICVLDEQVIVQSIHSFLRNNQLQIVDQVFIGVSKITVGTYGLLQKLYDMFGEETLLIK